MKIGGKIFLSIAIIVVVIGGVSLLGYIPNKNDLYATKFAEQLIQCPTPEGTVVLERHKLIGKLNGNGNGMDFAAIILLQTQIKVTTDDLIKYYSSFDFSPAKGKSHIVTLAVEQASQSDFNYFENRAIKFNSVMNQDTYHYYAIIIYDSGYAAGLDLRGN